MSAESAPSAPLALPAPSFDTESATLRFWVNSPDQALVGAILPRSALHYRFKGQADGSDAVAVYLQHRAEIDAAVLRRVAAGSREPVMLREHDLTPPASK